METLRDTPPKPETASAPPTNDKRHDDKPRKPTSANERQQKRHLNRAAPKTRPTPRTAAG